MKKHRLILFALVLLTLFCACAPKINQTKPNNNYADTSPTATPVYEPYALFFPDSANAYLVKETQELQVTETVRPEMRILSALKRGPKGDDLISPIPKDCEILSVKTLSGLCTIDVSDTFSNTDTQENYPLLIQSIVHSLCQLETVNEVKINIGGKQDVTVGDIDLSKPLSPDDSYLK